MVKTATVGTVGSEFRRLLRDAIKDPGRQMLLRADAVWRQHNPGGAPCRPVFETTSGRYHDEFVTLWKLFDERDLFTACVYRLTELARRARDEKGYTTIVTSTATAKHLVEYVHAKIESADDRIEVRHLGPYPFLGSGSREVINFHGEKVLIVADVVDSGTVVKNLAKAVRDLNGVPVAGICLVLVNEDHIRQMNGDGEVLLPVEPDAEESEKHLRVHSLTDYAIPEAVVPEDYRKKDREGGRWELIKIDPETLLPILPPPRHPLISPAIDAVTMYRQFETADAMAFEFFQTEAGLLTAAIRFEALFQRWPAEIWAAVRDHLQAGDDFKPPLVVTTFDWGDVQFKEFVETRLREEGQERQVVFAGRRDDGEYFILDHYRDILKDQRVVLLLSSVQSGEKVKDLATTLAGLQVREIRVVCLLNRMGRQTAEFLRRTQQLMRGLGETGDGAAPFTFHAVYCLPELSSDEIRHARDTVLTLLAHYQAATRVTNFRRRVSQVRAYFQPKQLTSSEFTGGSATRLHPEVRMVLPGGEEITVRTEEVKLSVLYRHVAEDRNYDPILDELATASRKTTLYKLFAALLADISYLRMLCRFSRLKRLLLDRVEECRKERLRLEADATARGQRMSAADIMRLDEIIELETYFLFGWALFSFLDQHFDYAELIQGVVTGGIKVDDWGNYPENFNHYYGDERVVWTASMLLLLSHARFRSSRRATPVRERLLAYLRKLIARVQSDLARRDPTTATSRADAGQTRLLKIKSNLDMLLTELGTHELRQPVDVIRYLHSLLLKIRQRHSPIETNMNQAVDTVGRAIRQSRPRTEVAREGLDLTNRRVPITDPDQLALLDDGIYVAGQLQAIADAINRLFFFSTSSAEKAERFLAPPERAGFAGDVEAFGDALQKIRRDKWVSVADRDKLIDLRRAILRDLWNDNSLVRRTLNRYVVALEPTILQALEVARKVFRGKPFEDAWDDEIARFRDVPQHARRYVLVEPLLLREVLKNIFTNVRYNLKGARHTQKGFRHLVAIAIDERVAAAVDGEEPSREWVVRVVSKGKKYDSGEVSEREETTLNQHRREINKYGGHLSIGPYAGKRRKGTEVELKLLSRDEYRLI